jgi:hypothetical protein
MSRAQNEILSLLAQFMFHRERSIKLFGEKSLVLLVISACKIDTCYVTQSECLAV